MIHKKTFIVGLLTSLGVCSYAFSQTKSKAVIDTELSSSRKKIDSLDKLLIEVLGSRQRVVREIGIYKKNNNIPPLQADRFKQVLNKTITVGTKEGLSPEFITEIMNAIHKESLRLEQ
nr:chorismate mutase [uncultured Pedobacter sp.]